jgi:hypothetical protein
MFSIHRRTTFSPHRVRAHESLDQIDSDHLSRGDSASSARAAQPWTTSINLVSTPAAAKIGADMVN